MEIIGIESYFLLENNQCHMHISWGIKGGVSIFYG